MSDLNDIYARLGAIDFVLKRLLASHAKMNPEGVGRNLIKQRQVAIDSLDTLGIPEPNLKLLKMHLETILEDAEMLAGLQ